MPEQPPPQKILWTLLPNGVRKEGEKRFLRMSVFISPRLGEQGKDAYTLEQFPLFVDWPARLKQATFGVAFDNGPTLNVQLTKPEVLDAKLWSDIFKKNTLVYGHVFKDHREELLARDGWFRSYQVRNVAAGIKRTYNEVSLKAPHVLPTLSALAKDKLKPANARQHSVLNSFIDNLSDIASGVKVVQGKTVNIGHIRATKLNQRLATLGRRAIEPALANDAAALKDMGFDNAQQFSFYQAHEFNSKSKISPAPRLLISKEFIPDFHKMIALFGDYPQILRKLGLVLDLEVPFESNVPAASTVRLIPPVELKDFSKDPKLTPRTKYVIAGDRFQAASAKGEIVNGVLALAQAVEEGVAGLTSSGNFTLVQFDIDDAAIKVVDYAGKISRQLASGSAQAIPGVSEDAGLPALRSSGIALARHGQEKNLEDGLLRSASLEASASPELTAEDLLRGYRVDILERGTNVWRSLCERTSTYTICEPDGKPIRQLTPQEIEPVDEGYVKTTTVTANVVKGENESDEDESDKVEVEGDLRCHESLFQWDGWSLSAPRPGRVIRPYFEEVKVEKGNIVKVQREKVERPSNIPITPLKVEFRAKPGSLPRLRFGKAYQLRVRTVDLAGNSNTIAEAPSEPQLISHPITYTRFEPVAPPAVMLITQIIEGESVEHLVIKSNHDKPAAEYAGTPKRPAAWRHLMPPKTAQIMAEMHGVFDESFGMGKNYQNSFDVATREAGTLFDIDNAKIITPPSVKEPNATEMKHIIEEGKTLVAGQYVIYPNNTLVAPYLPDVFARGVAFRGLPGVDKEGKTPTGLEVVSTANNELALKVPFTTTPEGWPSMQAFRLRVIEHPGIDYCTESPISPKPPEWDAKARLLTVYLPKAESVRVKYSCYLNSDDVQKMGLLKWTEDKDKATFQKQSEAGANWMVTPYRELVLVHAVQQPLCEPVIEKLAPTRSSGATSVHIAGEVRYSPESTGKLELFANWEEWIDDLSDEAGPRRIAGKGEVTDFMLDEHTEKPFKLKKLLNQGRHEFGDTKFRLVHYHLRATTAFREYFPAAITNDLEKITRTGLEYVGQGVRRFDLPQDPGALVLANQVNVEPGGVAILSSARPAAPKVAYIVPTFGWERSQAGNTITSKRLGGGLRVYLERPWFSSGDGELLGVVLPNPLINLANVPPKNLRDYFDQLKPYVTQIGKDPIFASNNPETKAKAELFKAAVHSQIANLDEMTLDEKTLDEKTKKQMAFLRSATVAGHRVEYDKERKLWFSDIVIDAGSSYYPFVRLALARLQPNSLPGLASSLPTQLPGLWISRVVLTDFMQLLPDRTARVTFSEDKKTLTVEVTGVQPTETYVSQNKPKADEGSGPLKNFIEVSVEVRNPDIKDENLCWMPAPDATIKAHRLIIPPLPLWRGNITLPEPAGSKKHRVVIKEFEVYYEDKPEPAGRFEGRRLANRLVYADAIEV